MESLGHGADVLLPPGATYSFASGKEEIIQDGIVAKIQVGILEYGWTDVCTGECVAAHCCYAACSAFALAHFLN